MKTWLASVFLLPTLGLLAQCHAPSSEDTDHLRLVWFGGEEEERIIRDCVAEFETLHPDLQVTVQMVEWSRYHEKVMTMLLGTRPPDVSRMSVQWGQRYHRLGALADIRPHLAEADLEDFAPARLASCRADDALFGLPHTTIGLLVYCNRDLFEQARIEIPRSPETAWTWEEFSDVAQTLQRRTGALYGWGLYRGWFPVIPFFHQSGGHLLTDSGDPDFAHPANVEALEWLVDQHRRGIAPQRAWTQGGDAAETLFVRGDCAMVITGNWRLRSYSRQIEDFRWGVAPLPQRHRRATNTGGENLAVFNTPRVEAATRLVEFLTRPEQMERFCTETLFLPTRRSLLRQGFPDSEHRAAMEMFALQSLDFEPAWADAQGTPEFAAIDAALGRQLELAMIEHRSARESLEALNRAYREARLQ